MSLRYFFRKAIFSRHVELQKKLAGRARPPNWDIWVLRNVVWFYLIMSFKKKVNHFVWMIMKCRTNNIKVIDIVIDQIISCKQSCQNNKWEKSIFNWEFFRKLWWLRSHSRYTLKVFKNQDNKGFFSWIEFIVLFEINHYLVLCDISTLTLTPTLFWYEIKLLILF